MEPQLRADDMWTGIAAAGPADVRDRYTEEERVDHLLPRVWCKRPGTVCIERTVSYIVKKYRILGDGI